MQKWNDYELGDLLDEIMERFSREEIIGFIESKENITKSLLSVMHQVSDNWDKLGLIDKSNYPEYLPSFDELIADLTIFFTNNWTLKGVNNGNL